MKARGFKKAFVERFEWPQYDLLGEPDYEVVSLNGRSRYGRVALHLRFGKPDERRNVQPLAFAENSTKCFCDFGPAHEPLESRNGFIFFWNSRAIWYSTECRPEPVARDFQDLMNLAVALEGLPVVLAVNLPGSGASIPQHFHAQFVPAGFGMRGEQRARLESILGNLSGRQRLTDGAQHTQNRDAVLTSWRIRCPLFTHAYRLEFDSCLRGNAIGRMLYHVVQTEMRRRSQLRLSYNLVIDLRQPRSCSVILRNALHESPFAHVDVRDIVAMRCPSTADRLAESPNRYWRWGWTECCGGLLARDDLFSNSETFDFRFWREVYDFVGIEGKYRRDVERHWHASLQSAVHGTA